MKKISSFFMVAMLTMLSVGCSSDNDEISGDNGSLNANDKFYMSIKVDLPTDKSGRANVGDAIGTEDGQKYENAVNNVRILLIPQEDEETELKTGNVKTINQGYVDAKITGNQTLYTVPFDKNTILDALGGQKKKKVYVLVLCNYGEKTINTLNDIAKINGLADVDNLIANQDKGFLMSNSEIHQIELSEDGLSKDPLKPYNLGTVKVERVAARFDYRVIKDGYKKEFTLANSNPNGGSVKVELTQAALTNISNSTYLFKRVSDDGQNTNATIFGAESNKYVVDVDADKKVLSDDKLKAEYKSIFYNMTHNAPNSNAFTYVNLPGTEGTDNNVDGSSIHKGDYARLFYCTENALPKEEGNANQKQGITTGIIFKAQIKNDNANGYDYGVELDNPTEDDAIYMFNGRILGTWNTVKTLYKNTDFIDKPENASLKAAIEQVIGDQTIDVAPENREVAVKSNFTIFKAEQIGDTGKYGFFTYYYYWNRHIDNGEAETMGAMEFAVVRNNVYKLYVKNIKKFGHSGDNTLDPDPFNPEDPDEDSNYYFEVNVEVQPWVVRQNDIEF